jgi:hypothetical protein
MLTFNAQEFLELLDGMQKSIGASWINIDNQAAHAIQLQIGNSLYTNPTTGSRYTNAGRTLIWQVDMQATGASVASSRVISSMKVGSTGIMVDVKTTEGEIAFTILTDKQYTVTVTGDTMLNTLAATIDMENPVDVDFDGVTW